MSSRTTRRSCLYRSTTRRCLKPRMDDLEPRALLSTAPMSMVAHPTFQVMPFASGGPPPERTLLRKSSKPMDSTTLCFLMAPRF